MKRIIAFLLISFFCFNVVEVDAKSYGSYLLLDGNSGRILYSQNEHERYLTASICKIMTAMVAIENGELFTYYEVKNEDLKTNGSAVYLEVGDKITLLDLLYALMLRSGNDAAMMISRVTFNDYDRFILEMNRLAHRIGMFNSTFENPTGLDDESFNYSTAYDMAILMRYAVNNPLFLMVSGAKNHQAKTVNHTYTWQHKHKLLQVDATIKAAKTGYTRLASRTLISYKEEANYRLIAVSFKQSDDYNLHKMLFKKAMEDYDEIKLFKAQVFPQNLDLKYYPELKEDIIILIKKESVLSYKIVLQKECQDSCGYLAVYEDQKLIYQVDLYPVWLIT